MKIKTFIFVLALLLLNLSMTACFAAEEVSVKVSKQFQISLDSNPSTGYTWEVNYDPKYLKLVKKRYIPDNRGGIIVGAGGKEIFTFLALKSGETSIIFNYRRVGQPVVKTLQYHVTIKK